MAAARMASPPPPPAGGGEELGELELTERALVSEPFAWPYTRRRRMRRRRRLRRRSQLRIGEAAREPPRRVEPAAEVEAERPHAAAECALGRRWEREPPTG